MVRFIRPDAVSSVFARLRHQQPEAGEGEGADQNQHQHGARAAGDDDAEEEPREDQEHDALPGS